MKRYTLTGPEGLVWAVYLNHAGQAPPRVYTRLVSWWREALSGHALEQPPEKPEDFQPWLTVALKGLCRHGLLFSYSIVGEQVTLARSSSKGTP